MKRLFWIAALVVFSSCINEKALIQKFAPKDDDEFARKFIALVRQAQYTQADRMVDPAVTLATGPAPLTQFHQILDHGEPLAFEIVGANVGFFRPWNGSESKRQTNLTYQIQFRDAWAVASFVIESSSSGKYISTANLQPITNSLEVLNRFTLKNKSEMNYLFFAACILIPLFIAITIVICIRSRVRFRWLWIVFILFAIMQFSLNWTTGEVAVRPVSILLLGASFFRAGLYAPLVFSFGIPAGAIVFLVLRPWLRSKDEPAPIPTGPSP